MLLPIVIFDIKSVVDFTVILVLTMTFEVQFLIHISIIIFRNAFDNIVPSSASHSSPLKLVDISIL